MLLGHRIPRRGERVADRPVGVEVDLPVVRVVAVRPDGEHGPGQETGKFLSPHGLAVDSRGDIYVGEVSYTNWGGTHPGVPVPKYLRSLQKLEKVK